MVHIHGSVPPPSIPPQSQNKKADGSDAQRPAPQVTGSVGKNVFQLDSAGIAVRMAALAMDAKEKELSFDEIVEKVIKETGLADVQAAFEEANRKMQKDIEDELEKIKSNKELMEEAQSWEELADLLENKMTPEQIHSFMGMLEAEVKNIKGSN